MDKACVTVLMGGPDAERAVSLDSGTRVAEALEADERLQVVRRVVDRPDESELRAMLIEDGADVVFPVLHGIWGEGGPLQSMLQSIGVPYVGSGPQAAQKAMHKLRTKSLALEHGIPTPPARAVMPDQPVDLKPPLVVKPIEEGSSVGVYICFEPDEVTEAVAKLSTTHPHIMCERYIKGRELTIGILGDEPLVPIEIKPHEGVYDYESKYERNDTGYEIDPPLSDELRSRLASWSAEISRLLGVRDLARVDWRVDGEEAWLLEVNTMPGMTSHSLLPKAAAAGGIDMTPLCVGLVDRALARSTGSWAASVHPTGSPSRK